LGGVPISLLDFVKKVIKIYGKGSFEIIPFPKKRKKIEIGDYKASWKKIKKAVGWKPVVGVDAGIKKTIDYYLKYKKHYW